MVEDKEIEIDFKGLKNIKWTYVLLGLFLILGFYLRAYHLDFPSIGYHNMKENEYLSEAIIFHEQGDFLHRKTFNFWGLEDGPGYFEEYAQAPLVPYMTVLGWQITGQQIWLPRLIIIIFSLLSIVAIYLLVKQLSDNEYLSLLSAFLLTVLPLGIYFGRNIQPDMPALFCVLLSFYFFIKWKDTYNKNDLFYSALAISFAGLFKMTFLVAALPILILAPYEKIIHWFKKDKKELFQQICSGAMGILPFVIIQSIFEFTIKDPSKKNVDIGISTFFNIFSGSYWGNTWPAVNSYIADNYTWFLMWIAVVGFVFAVMKRDTKLGKFLLAYSIAIPVYAGLLSGKIGGHSYYQLPFLPLIAILIAYALVSMGSMLKQISKINIAVYLPLILIILAAGEMEAANNRVWNTVFFGQDVVGEYIQQNTVEGDRFFNLAHAQTQAVCAYAKRRCGDYGNLSTLKEYEEKFNIKYMNMDSYSYSMLQTQRKEEFEYIAKNYHIALVGLIQVNGQQQMVNILLEKGGSFDLSEVQNKQLKLAKTYEMKQGSIPFYIIENDN